MPRVHYVKAAAKDNPAVKAGESYYWWAFRYGGKRYSRTAPRPSQLTQSDFQSRQRAIEEAIAELKADDLDTLRGEVESLVDEIRQLGEEQAEKAENLPDGLRDGPTGELLTGRADSCEEWASNLEGVDLDIEEPDDEAVKAEYEEENREPTRDDVDTDGLTEEEVTAEAEKLHEEWETERDAQVEARHEEYDDAVAQALEELQGYGYEGE